MLIGNPPESCRCRCCCCCCCCLPRWSCSVFSFPSSSSVPSSRLLPSLLSVLLPALLHRLPRKPLLLLLLLSRWAQSQTPHAGSPLLTWWRASCREGGEGGGGGGGGAPGRLKKDDDAESSSCGKWHPCYPVCVVVASVRVRRRGNGWSCSTHTHGHTPHLQCTYLAGERRKEA